MFKIIISAFSACLLAGGAAADEAFTDTFDAPPAKSGWRLSDYTHPDNWIRTRWDPKQVLPSAGALTITLEPEIGAGAVKPFVSGELNRKARSGYGRYETVMRAARGDGLVTGFFTYTGPHVGDPHDEIDIEILGKDTTEVTLNYFKDKSPAPTVVDLGFDAAEGFHHYAFEWAEDEIRWYADGRLIHKTGPGDPPPPQTPGRLYLSLWTGDPGWLGKIAADARGRSEFTCVSYTPDLSEPPRCAAP